MLTHARLREILHYDPGTGIFTWRVRTSNRIKIGDAAGGVIGNGYFMIGVDGVRYYGHRLAWFWMKGEWPDPECDHEDTDPLNNKWSNLRESTSSQNKRNSNRSSRNTSGFKGVSWDKRAARWRATIQDGKSIHLGFFDAPELAHAAYVAAANRIAGEFARV